MKIAFFVGILLLIVPELFPQNLSPEPTEGGTRFFYRAEAGMNVQSISVAGTFNNWKAGEYMFINSTDANIWTVVVPLESGKEVFYKFIINDTLWITDPNAPFVTEDEWRNGVIYPVRYGYPYISNVQPANGQRITKLFPISVRLVGFNAEVDKNSINCSLNGELIDFCFDQQESRLSAELPKDLPDGEHLLEISFNDLNGNKSGIIHSRFFADRFITPVISPLFYDSAVMYEIYIRTFADSDGDGIGDFAGLTSRLGYLADTLGVNTIWLMPWNESTTDHGYNVVDYYSIEKDYGTFEDFTVFLKECKKRNVKVIMDFVINHTDSTHIWFLDAYYNPESKYSQWYQFTQPDNSDWNHFGLERKMPKLNFNNPEVGEYFLQVARFWLDPNGDGDFSDGVDGFRCDAAKEVPHKYWNIFRKFVKDVNPNALILGEVWDNINYLIPFFKDEFDMLFDYPNYYSQERYLMSGDVTKFIADNQNYEMALPAGHQLVRFLSNHDNKRPFNVFDGNLKKLRQSLFLTFSLPGTPMLYYGDELLYTGVMPPENVRNSMGWSMAQDSVTNTGNMFNFYRELIQMRKKHPELALRNDSQTSSLKVFTDTSAQVFCFLRYSDKTTYLGVVNNSGKPFKDLVFGKGILDSLVGDKQFDLERIIGNEIQSDKFRGLVFPTLERSDNYLFLSSIFINNGGFILYKLNRE